MSDTTEFEVDDMLAHTMDERDCLLRDDEDAPKRLWQAMLDANNMMDWKMDEMVEFYILPKKFIADIIEELRR